MVLVRKKLAVTNDGRDYYGVNVLLYKDGKVEASTGDSFAAKEWRKDKDEITAIAKAAVLKEKEPKPFMPRFDYRNKVEAAVAKEIDQEKTAGAHQTISYTKENGKVYIKVEYRSTNGDKVGRLQKKRFLVNKDFSLTVSK